MTTSSWSLVIPVLAIGLALGSAWVFWWGRRRKAAAGSESRDRELLLADLRARQEQLYAELRQATPVERDALELAAARNLRAIEQAGGGASTQGEGGAVTALPDAAAPSPARGTSPVLGFVGGVACAALVAMLVVWAQRDAQPKLDEGMPMVRAQDEAHPDGPPLGERERQALQELAAMIDDDPTDMMARKQYAVGLLSTSQFVPAFEQAEILLASDPDDPDGLYVKGMVRMRMGNTREAQGLLEQLVVDYPDHVPALTALGVLALREGGLPAAEEFWQQALEISGGRNPEVERLMAAAREQFGGEGAAPASAGPDSGAVAPARAAAPTADGPAFTLELELEGGAVGAAQAVLFVSIRGVAGGPPTAVKRINAPRFPLTVTLSAADSMMGQPLPETGLVVVRLDLDGNASTRTEGEPEGEMEMRLGETARLTLK